MTKTLTRIFTVTLLMMVSMGAEAKIDLQIANDGKFDGGTIEVTDQKDMDDGVEVTITVTPNDGYTITKDAIIVVSTYPPSGARSDTRAPEIAENLKLYYKGSADADIDDSTAKRDYTFIVPSGFGVWVKEATFISGSKDGGGTRTDYSGMYFIASRDYVEGNTTTNFYLCPTENWYYYQSESPYYIDTADPNNVMPFLTTYQCRDGSNGYTASNAVWIIEKKTGTDYYYIKHANSGRYLTYNVAMGNNSNAGRMRLHLEASPADNDALFSITWVNNKSSYDIITKNSGPENNRKYLNITGASGGKTGNQPSLQATNVRNDGPSGLNVGGILGLWTSGSSGDNNSKWYLEPALSIAPPTITNNYDGTFTITAEEGATIYYTTDDSTPSTSTSTTGTTSVNVNQTESMTVIKAIAKAASDPFPTEVAIYDIPVCDRPVITVANNTVTITVAEGTTVYYTTDDTEATTSSTQYAGAFPLGSATAVRAIAIKSGYCKSSEAFYYGMVEVHSSSEISYMTRSYKLASDFTSDASIGTAEAPFKGTIDGNMVTLSGLNHPLVGFADGAIIKNVILDNVSISSGTNVGAICGEATGDTRIYNCGVLASNSTAKTNDDGYTYLTDCSSTISGSGYVGGIVGLLDGSSRVINCFSYANVSGGTHVGGIVGYNNVATTATNLKTMVMNCMFYGEVSGVSIAPIYNGEIITNVGYNTGVSNFNYFRLESSYIQNTTITKVYNCALGAETRFLQRFEFFRHLLNSNRELAAWWATGNADNKDEMMRWVMEPSQIGTTKPYPILKTPGKYPSVVNYTPNETTYDSDHRNEGRKLGILAVTIQSGSGGAAGASLTTTSLNLTITDKDFEHFNFNYGKVQLPYYNDVGTKNYTDGKVVTGWKIVSITGGTAGSYSTGSDVTYNASGELTSTPYNFADRNCTNKDLYGSGGSNRVFNQGAYWDVPEGVTAITIEPYWGKAVYLGDAYLDVVYSTDMKTSYNVTTVGGGQRYTNGVSTFNDQLIYTAMSNAVTALSPSGTVYDNAVVLVGNFHQYGGIESGNKPYTVTSVDLDGDNEPDYSFMLRFDNRTPFHPVRYDFLNLIGLGMAQKSTGGTGSYNFGIMQPKYWFEVTNTALFHITQFEYSRNDRVKNPYILQGGVIEQWVTQQNDAGDRVSYFHVGGNVWFKEFHRGSHQDNTGKSTPHPPVSVTGGDYNKFYLTGLYQSQAAVYDDNAECYINGGRFGEMAGAGMEGIGKTAGKGNITWLIDNADIKEFYGGGINYDKPVHGNIHTIISNSYVNQFCGGPKFGDMEDGRTVITMATNSTFGTYFGAGYGGNAYNRYAPQNQNEVMNIDWNAWVEAEYTQSYNSTYGGVSTQIDYQFIPRSDNTTNVARLFVDYVGFSLATCKSVTSSLTGCKITSNFYGGGSLGKVEGNVNSTLTNCEVVGSAFGAGFSASLPPVEVMNTGGFQTEPYYYEDLGTYRVGVFPATTTYTWQHADAIGVDNTEHILYTNVDLSTLGAVTGNVKLIIEGTTSIGESVYGGGEESAVGGNTEVVVTGGTIGYEGAPKYADLVGNVYGGGRGLADKVTAGLVKGNTKITISGDAESPHIFHNVYGGGALGSVGDYDYNADGSIQKYNSGGSCEVNILGGKIGRDGDAAGHNNGMVNGASRGEVGVPDANGVDKYDNLAWVHDTHVMIGDAAKGTNNNGDGKSYEYPVIKGSVYGSGENGHTYQNTIVDVHSGTIGVEEIGLPDNQRFVARGNVYGSGCGTDTYEKDGKTYYNLYAGIVLGTATVNIDGGHVIRNVYGAGSNGSVGTFTLDTDGTNNIPDKKPVSCAEGGITYVNVSGGMIGTLGGKMHYDDPNIGPDDFGHVFGAGRGELQDSTVYVNMALTGYVKETHVTISPKAFITGSVYGGGECGHTLGDTYVTVEGGQIGVGDGETGLYTDWTATSMKECTHWPYTTTNSPYDKYSGDTGYDVDAAKGGSKKATDGHTFNGNVFGGGSGYYPYAPGKWVRSAGLVEGNTHVTISGGHILSNVYGGNEHTDVYGSCTVTMTGGTVGVPRTWQEKRDHPVVGSLFGAGKGDKRVLFNTWTNVASTHVTVSGGRVYGSVFGGGEDGHVLGDAITTIEETDPEHNPTIIGTLGTTGYDGHVFGGGRGSYTALTAGVVCGNVSLNIKGGKMLGSIYGGGRLASVGTHLVPPTATGSAQSEHKYYGKEIADGKKQIIWKYWDNISDNDEDDDDPNGKTHGHIVVNISGGTIGAVDSNGKLLNSQFSIGDVFGGCKGTSNGEYSNKVDYNPIGSAQARLGISKSAVVNLIGGTVGNAIYGGGEVGNVGELGVTDISGESVTYESADKAFAKVNLLGGTVKNVFGGGLGMKKNVNGATEDVEALVKGDVKVNLNGLEQGDYEASLHSSKVTAFDEGGTGGTFYRTNDGCTVTGTIFGCNNLNGTPTGHAKVHVFKTKAKDGQAEGDYDVAAVYGGGNQADYKPAATETKQKTEVIIEGCDLTSIQQVYGGGNAAATPGTLVLVKGSKIIFEVFGGGNGVSTEEFENPGANVGYYTGTETAYGGNQGGKALVQLMAGKVTYAYGGSNTKGNIRGGSNVETVNNEWTAESNTACCKDLVVDHMFGGGKNAGMKSGANIILGCSNSNVWVKEIYAGAENADVEGDVGLTITSGKFGRVFGGNKESGKLEGSITVNIEENGKCGIPVIIGELYGGGNKAPYSIYGYNSDGSPKTGGSTPKNPPVVNIKAFTSIGNVYGGGYGERAVMYGSPTVNINEVAISHTDTDAQFVGNRYSGETIYFKNGVLDPTITSDPSDMTNIEKVTLLPHEDGKMGVIGNVFGGGNAAAVHGNTTVKIGTEATQALVQLDGKGEPMYNTDGSPKTTTMDVLGVDIRGNVYGGGNKAAVTGNTDVVIGQKKE